MSEYILKSLVNVPNIIPASKYNSESKTSGVKNRLVLSVFRIRAFSINPKKGWI